MQNYIIRYVETLKARIEPTGCSIQAAIDAELPCYDRRALLKLRDAALDLQRIAELELGRRDDCPETGGAHEWNERGGERRCVHCREVRDRFEAFASFDRNGNPCTMTVQE